MVAEWCEHCNADISVLEQIQQGRGKILTHFICPHCGKQARIHEELYD